MQRRGCTDGPDHAVRSAFQGNVYGIERCIVGHGQCALDRHDTVQHDGIGRRCAVVQCDVAGNRAVRSPRRVDDAVFDVKRQILDVVGGEFRADRERISTHVAGILEVVLVV